MRKVYVLLVGSMAAVAAGTAVPSPGSALLPAAPAVVEVVTPAIEPATVTAQPLPTWQTDGVVYAVEAVGDVVYVGGSFDTVRPPGAEPGIGEVPRRNLAAFDASTGDLLPFSHDVRSRDLPVPSDGYDKTCRAGSVAGTYTCDTVYEIRTSADQATVYVGGDFETVDGKQRPKLAAFATATGAVTPFRVWGTNGRVRSLAVTTDRIYYGGGFSSSDGQPRTRLASAWLATGAVTPWAPSTDGTVFALAMSPDGTAVLAGGDFDTVNGVGIRGLAPLDATTGALARWDSRVFPGRLGSSRSYVTDLAVDADTVYAAANGEGAFDGRVAFDPTTGQPRWIDSCLGATWAVEVVGQVLYSGSHAHNCTPTTGGFPETNASIVDADDRHYHRLLAQTAREGTTTRILHWFPTTNGGIVGKLGPRDMTHTATTLWVAGEFTTVDEAPQSSLTRFAYEPGAPSAAAVRPAPPLAVSDTAGTVEVRWETTTDNDDETLTYTLFRDGVLVASATASASSKPFWVRPQLAFTDTGLTPGATVGYQVRATDDSGRTSVKSWITSVVVADATSAYRAQVLADGAALYWPLDEASSRFAGSLAAAGGPGRYASAGVDYRVPGATTAPHSSSVTLNGSTGRIRGTLPTVAPDVFSAEVWFRSSTTRGGKVLGFGTGTTQRSSTADRHVYMANNGRLVMGLRSGSNRTITTSRSYNDGAWHHLVATQGSSGMRLYVDGTLNVRSSQSYDPVDYTGYWQLGGDTLSGWSTAPSSLDLAGSLDEFAVYPSELSAGTVALHHALGRS